MKTWSLFFVAGALVGGGALGGCSSSDEPGDSGEPGDGDVTGTGGENSPGTGGSLNPGSGGMTAGDGDMTATGGGQSGCTMDMCEGGCVDLQRDDANCGVCGTACEEYHSCQSGACVRTACEGALSLCGSDCANVTADVDHCGSCDNTCDLGFICASSECACAGERTECDGYCAHPDFDRQHCGGCSDDGGVACASDEACLSGSCGTIAIPNNSYCQVTDSWSGAHTALEFEILDIVNRRRAEGATCGERGYFPPAGPLQMEASLRCAARVHTRDMVINDYFSHTNLQSEGPGPRLTAAGYSGQGWGENIAAGRGTAEGTMEQWMGSDGHCANLMNAGFNRIGIGYFPGDGAEYGHYWTQTFGK